MALSAPEHTSTRPAMPAAPLEVHTFGRVSAEECDRARAMVGAVLARHAMAAGGARIRLTGSMCAGGPMLVQVNLRVCGARARVQVPGRSAADAIAAGAVRLDRQIHRLTTAWRPWPWPDPQRRALGLPDPGDITRCKSFRLNVGMPCQASAVMNAMDYDAHLHTDVETGEDAIIYRAGPTGLRLARQHSMHPPTMPVTLPLTVNSRRIETLTATAAAATTAT